MSMDGVMRMIHNAAYAMTALRTKDTVDDATAAAMYAALNVTTHAATHGAVRAALSAITNRTDEP